MHKGETRPVLTRIVACQGAVQLASAIAAMWTTSGRSEANASVKNHLLVHDLSAPDGQGEEFAECIRTLAEKVDSWESFRYISLAETVQLQREMSKSDKPASDMLAAWAGTNTCDELYTGQNNKFIPTWLRRATPAARHVCFGDGIALNFANSYFRPKEYGGARQRQPWAKRLRRNLRQRIKRWLGRSDAPASSTQDEIGFDAHCLLLENLFDQKLPRVTQLQPEVFVELFQRFGDDLPTRAQDAHASLSRLADQPGHNVVLLTSNFSETGRMSLHGELEGYRRLLASMPKGAEATLIIKPHPRDSYEKIAQLREAVAPDYGHTLALNDPWTFYLPFESIYDRYLARNVCGGRETHVATVSSACISLEYLYGQECQLGFGSDIVACEFVPLWSDLRQIHERDLQAIVPKLRKRRRNMARLERRYA